MVRLRHRLGFTLIELLVVVAILALLLAILLPTLSRAREVSKRTVGASRLYAIGRAISMYASENEGRMMYCERATWATSGQGGTGQFGELIQMVSYYGWKTDTVGMAYVLSRTQQADFAISNAWVSGGVNVKNPFLLNRYGQASQPIFWDTIKNSTNWPSGNKGFVLGSYFNFIGEPGNVNLGNNGSQVYFSSIGPDVLDTRFDDTVGNKTRLQNLTGRTLLMQDIARREPTNLSGFYNANYLSRPGGYQMDSYAETGAKLGLSSGAYAQVTGFYVAQNATDIAGVNALFADGSVDWNGMGQLDTVYYKAPGQNTSTLFLAKR